MEKDRILKILMVRLSALGDVIQLLPALRVLRSRFPRAHIGWVVEEGAAPLLKNHPDLDEVVVLPRKRWQRSLRQGKSLFSLLGEIYFFLQKLRSIRYDIAIDFHGNFRSGFLLSLLKVRKKVGFDRTIAREGSFLFLNQRIPVEFNIHKTERYIRLLEKTFDFSVEKIPLPRFSTEELVEETTGKWLATLPSKRHLVVFHPGVSPAYRIKKWNPSFYGQVIRKLSEELDALIVLSWGPGEKELVDEIAGLSGVPVYPTPEVFSLAQMVSLFKEMDLFVASDTGPLHLATSLGKAVVGLYGPKPPEIYRPYFTGEALIEPCLPCVPCNHKSCLYKEAFSPCMAALSPERVFQASLRQLAPLLQKGGPVL